MGRGFPARSPVNPRPMSRISELSDDGDDVPMPDDSETLAASDYWVTFTFLRCHVFEMTEPSLVGV